MEALRIAGTNAANARADADAAETYAASLGAQLQALRDVVDETKRASQVLYKEHEQVSKSARVVEAKLVQRETEFARSQTKQRQLMEERGEWKAAAQKLEGDRKLLENKMQQQEEELRQRIKEAEEWAILEQARKDRSAMVEKELREARGMLAGAAATAAETEATTVALNETIQGLQAENKTLHERIRELQDSARSEQERLNEALSKVEKEAQSLRIKSAAHEEDMQRLRVDKSASDKQVTQHKTRIATLERRLKEATSIVPPSPDDSESPVEAPSTRRGATFSIPPLQAATPGASKTRGAAASKVTPAFPKKSNKCSICSQPASGFMKSCQCGKPTCDKRAHSNCVAASSKTGPSVSHPGTPATRVPLVLCDNART